MLKQLRELLNKENIILLLAVCGALSTYKVVSDYRKSVRRIKVELSYDFHNQGNNEEPSVITLRIVNMGSKEVTLNSMGYILPDGTKVILIEPQSNVSFPHTLSEGKDCSIWNEQREWAEELRRLGYSGNIKIIGFYGSNTGEIFKSEPIDFDIESTLSGKGLIINSRF